MTKPIKQSVINSFIRCGIPYIDLQKREGTVTVYNRFGGGSAETNHLLNYLVQWVYATSNAYEVGDRSVRLDDFDRIRYFILDQDSNVYMTCID